MLYRFLADIVVLAHLGFVAFVLFGGLLAFRWPRVAWIHLPALAWGGFIEFTGAICPLTPLENALRHAGGLEEYSQGFIERYVVPIVYPTELTRESQILMGVMLVALNALIYARLAWRRSRRSPR